MVRLSIALQARSPAAARALLDTLRLLAVGTRLEPGCVTCIGWSEPHGIRYVEEWATDADMRQRIRSEAFTSLLALAESAVDARVQFDFITTTRGFDYVEEVRNSFGR
jgi:hypothetical protein